jgi:hypothetical protein
MNRKRSLPVIGCQKKTRSYLSTMFALLKSSPPICKQLGIKSHDF